MAISPEAIIRQYREELKELQKKWEDKIICHEYLIVDALLGVSLSGDVKLLEEVSRFMTNKSIEQLMKYSHNEYGSKFSNDELNKHF